MADVYLSKWLTYMDFNKYNPLLCEIIKADGGPCEKFKEIVFQLSIPERITFLNYILDEYEMKAIDNMFAQRWEHEVPPAIMKVEDIEGNLSPREQFYLHLQDLHKEVICLCDLTIPEMVKSLEKSIKAMIEREKVLGTLPASNEGPIKDEESIDINEAAAYLGVSKKTMYKYNSEGIIPYHTVGGEGGKLCKYYRSDLIKLRETKKKKTKES